MNIEYATEYIKNVCKIGQEREQCKYLSVELGVPGEKRHPWACHKMHAMTRQLIDVRESMAEMGDNCEGVENLNEKL